MLKLIRDAVDESTWYSVIWIFHILADADVPNFPFGNHLLKYLPSRVWVFGQFEIDLIRLAVLLERNRPFIDVFSKSFQYKEAYTPMHEVKIKIFGPQVSEGLIESLLNITWLMERIPKFRGQPDVLARDPAVLQGFADFGFILMTYKIRSPVY
jgi:hypothetical protein